MFWLGKEAPTEYANKYYKELDWAVAENTIIGEVVSQSIIWSLDNQIIIGNITQEVDGIVISNTLIDNINCNG